ncbi:hypothetical protein CEXT_500181 [Caerostris extrusa]|uniref:Uncharacterized protein n=1 Tax=Caerostris extrusa TaxID=172846 RepID=A0AAV4WQ91_CAEEX|nr:hypothetical protein CEXT_500181 [Caerostris extrusa]
MHRPPKQVDDRCVSWFTRGQACGQREEPDFVPACLRDGRKMSKDDMLNWGTLYDVTEVPVQDILNVC